jgi:hypothetical protein
MSSAASLLPYAGALVDLLTRQSPPKGALPGASRKQPFGALTCPPGGFSVWSSRGTSTFWIYPE